VWVDKTGTEGTNLALGVIDRSSSAWVGVQTPVLMLLDPQVSPHAPFRVKERPIHLL
jgi:hypothetical protein